MAHFSCLVGVPSGSHCIAQFGVDLVNLFNKFNTNQLEKLKGDRQHYYSIRVNQQWRLCFVWRENEAHNVMFVDYH